MPYILFILFSVLFMCQLNVQPVFVGFTIVEPATTLPLNIHNKRERIPIDRTIINCDLYPDLGEENDAKVVTICYLILHCFVCSSCLSYL